MAGGNYSAMGGPFPKDFPAAIQAKKMQAEAAFIDTVMAHSPPQLPVPIVDVYAKGGLAANTNGSTRLAATRASSRLASHGHSSNRNA